MPHFTAADGSNLFYLDTGDGLPVLCLAGLTRNHHDFDYVLPHLTGCRVIRMDYRGRGESDWPGPETYTIPQEGVDALALLDHLGLDRAAILGTSRGGLIAMVLATTAHERLLGVALNDIGPEIADEGMTDISSYLGRDPAARNFEEFVSQRARALPGFEDVPLERWRADIDANFIEIEGGGVKNRYDNRLRDAVLNTQIPDAVDLWPLFDALDGLPLALIRGENSNLLGAQTAAEMLARRPDMIFAEVPKRGHVPFLDEPAAVAALQAWIKEMQ